METGKYTTFSEEETLELAKKLAVDFSGSEVVLLTGALGAGKTVFVRGIAAGLGLEDLSQVCSPSYTLINIYKAKCTIFHMDLFRLDKKADIIDLGWEDWLGEGVVLVEWGEKLDYEDTAIFVDIEFGDNEERIIEVRKQ